MTPRTRLSSLALLAVLSLVLTSLVSSPADAAKGRTRGKVNYGVTSWIAGTSGYSIKGKASGAKHRRVALQVKWADGWHTIDKSKTKRKGKFKINGTLNWYGAHKLRVSVPRTRRDAAKNFKSTKFTISPSWVPLGAATSYTTYSSKGRRFQWDPCQTIGYRINPGTAGEAAIPFTQEAVERLERATGFRTKYLGTTTTQGLSKKRYPKRTDLIIAWSPQDTSPVLKDNVVGWGGFRSSIAARRRSNNKPVWAIRQMHVTMNMAQVPLLPFAFDAPDSPTLGAALIHELGHAVGLDHFADGVQVMNPDIGRTPTPTGYHADYEAGDLAGLRAQGAQGGCLKPWRDRRHRRVSVRGLPSTPAFARE